jgi:hypothetical protein
MNDRMQQQARPKPPMQLRSWTPRRSGTLRGFASISVPAIGLELDDISVHVGELSAMSSS